MRAKRAFTLTELLAVLGIMLVMVLGAVGVLVGLAGQMGPGRAVNSLQSMVYAARETAATRLTDAKLVFRVNDDTQDTIREGSYVAIWYRNPESDEYEPLPYIEPVNLGTNLYVIRLGADDMSNMPELHDIECNDCGTEFDFPTGGDAGSLTCTGCGSTNLNYKHREQQLHEWLTAHVTGGTPPRVLASHTDFELTVHAGGHIDVVVDNEQSPDYASAVPVVLVIVQFSGGQVRGHAYYPMNLNTGTRLVFE